MPHTTVKANYLKGQFNEIFNLYFFHQSTPTGPLTNGLKYFQFWSDSKESQSPRDLNPRRVNLPPRSGETAAKTFELKSLRGLMPQQVSFVRSVVNT